MEMAEAGSGRRTPSRALLTVASTAFSLLLHGSVLAAALILLDDTPGAVPKPTEAISLELFQTEVIEAVAVSQLTESAASLASVEQDPGESADSLESSSTAQAAVEPPSEVAVREQTETQVDDAKGFDVLKGAGKSDEAIGQERSEPRRKLEREPEFKKRPAKPIKTAKLTDPSKDQDTESARKKKGAAASRASKGSAQSSARVSASSGSAVNYAAQVRARVASRKPGGGGKRGTVVISFGVTRSGGLSYASIARSSGNPALDRTVLSAVRGAAPFPTPPPGAQLRFAVPFHFR